MCFSLYTTHPSDTLIARRVLKPIHNLKIETNERLQAEMRSGSIMRRDRICDVDMRCGMSKLQHGAPTTPRIAVTSN